MTTQEMIDCGKGLKAKYRNSDRPHIGNYRIQHRDKVDPPEGTLTKAAGSNHSKAGGNSGHASKVITLRPRQRAWGPWA